MTIKTESGIALVAALLMTLLVSALLVGFTALVISDGKIRTADGDGTQALYAAHAGLEKLTSDLGTLFEANYAPTGAQINALMSSPPSFPQVGYYAPDNTSGYQITFTASAQGNPVADTRTIASGPFQGFIGLLSHYDMTVTARGLRGSEAQLRRSLQTVSIPLFQFGLFSDSDLSFHPGPDFDFGGRVHTNGNLYLASGNTLLMSDRITALGEVVRTHLANGWTTAASWAGNVRILTSPGSYRNLATTEGSLTGTIGSPQNEPMWTNLSIGDYNGNIRNGRTGAKRLDLPIVSFGATPNDLVRRPPATELTTSPTFTERYFSMASIRILLSDTAGDITGLPSVSATAPISLDTTEPYAVDATHPPFAESGGGAQYHVPLATPLLGGFIKVEKQTAPGAWTDVTLDVLSLGIAGPNLQGAACAQPNPDAVLRLQAVRNNSTQCRTGTLVATNYYPKTLYDAREAKFRDDEPVGNTAVYFGGVMHYVELDVNNLRRWMSGTIGANGTGSLNVGGFTIYFSDRRTNRDAANLETGDYGAEDFVNPDSATGAPDGLLNTGEDTNANTQLDTYGQNPGGPAVAWTAPFDNASNPRPWTTVDPGDVQANPARFFRRALKLYNGRRGNIIAPGLTVVSENPVYIQGDYNADAGFGDPHVATSVLADAVTLLSNSWSDYVSFTEAHHADDRNGSETWYRVAILAGKGIAFPKPTAGAPANDFGSDGGTHNFLRYLEDFGGTTVHYRGSMASLYYNRQALGVYKVGANVYSPPTRDYKFDTDFLTPSLLPPRTPMFRDVNTLGFTRVLR